MIAEGQDTGDHKLRMRAAFFLLALPIASSLANFPIVHTSYGAVRGYAYRAENGFVGEIFKKIPYASPPIGPLRWKLPLPPEPWNYTVDGTFFGPACAQVDSFWTGYVTGMSEDCLAVNVYTSKECRESGASCPVVYYVHGGSTLFSGPHQYTDEVLITNYATQGVILVTGTYRLGVFGAMAFGDENALPANLALHDVVLSLEFIRDEIHVFGGDKNQITIWGHSAGSTIVNALVFSPAFNKQGETPLFAGAISMSPTAIFESEEKQTTRSYLFAKTMGCAGTAEEIIECLRPFSTDELLRGATKAGGENTFSLTHVSGITAAGDLFPIRNRKELREYRLEHPTQLPNGKPTRFLSGTLIEEFGRNNSGENVHGLAYQVSEVLGVRNNQDCVDKYFRDIHSGKFSPGYDTLSQAFIETVALFGSAQVQAGGEVYLYSYDYPKHSSHADDLYYLMGVQKFAEKMDENEEWLNRVYHVYFTNFIKGLAPAPDWTPLDPALMNYYSINKSFTDGISPKMKYGYHDYLTSYYENMLKFDEQLTISKQLQYNAPVQYRDVEVVESSTSFSGSHSFLDISCLLILCSLQL